MRGQGGILVVGLGLDLCGGGVLDSSSWSFSSVGVCDLGWVE